MAVSEWQQTSAGGLSSNIFSGKRRREEASGEDKEAAVHDLHLP